MGGNEVSSLRGRPNLWRSPAKTRASVRST